MKILVFMGGYTEREVSLLSGNEVANSLISLGHDVRKIDSKNFKLLSFKDYDIDLIFNALHGGMGENGVLQGFFELTGLPYTGSGVLASSMAMNKIIAKVMFSRVGINVAKDKLVDIRNIIKKDPMPRPYVLKPVDGGSSIDVEIIDKNFDTKSLYKKDTRNNYFVEQFIDGREFSVAVLDDNVLGIIEIKYSENFYNYNAKYKNSKTRYIIPTDINNSTKNKLEEYALKAHKALGCRGLTRSDFRLPINQLENPVLLEINTSPGLTSHSLVPKIANNSGLSYDELIAKILDRALN